MVIGKCWERARKAAWHRTEINLVIVHDWSEEEGCRDARVTPNV